MLIFDSFPSLKKAEAFARYAKKIFKKRTKVYTDADEAWAADPIIVGLIAPVVHVERCDIDDENRLATEEAIEHSVEQFGGEFVGT